MEAPRAVVEAGAVGKAEAVMEGARCPWVLQQERIQEGFSGSFGSLMLGPEQVKSFGDERDTTGRYDLKNLLIKVPPTVLATS